MLANTSTGATATVNVASFIANHSKRNIKNLMRVRKSIEVLNKIYNLEKIKAEIKTYTIGKLLSIQFISTLSGKVFA